MNEEEENNPIVSEAPPVECQKTLDADLTDTAELSPSDQHDNDADNVLFVGAAPEVSTIFYTLSLFLHPFSVFNL
jgi:hypothetical protein